MSDGEQGLGCRGRPFVQYPFGYPFLSKFLGTGIKGLFQGGRRREGSAKKKKKVFIPNLNI